VSVASPRLGRGLAALMGDAPAAEAVSDAGRGAIRALPVEKLEPGPFQPRTSFDPAALGELVESIQARGILQPLLARPHPRLPDQYQIIAGERRWRAAQQAGLHEVPVLVRDLSDQDAMSASLVENLQRQDLNPIEESEGFRRLMDEFGLTQESLSVAVGKSRSHIANTLRLLHLPAAVRAEVQRGRLTAGHARALLTHPEPETIMKAVIERGLSVRQTEALAAPKSVPLHPPSKHVKSDDTRVLERELSEKLGLVVQISYDGTGGSLTLKYRNLDQLDSLMTLLTRLKS